MKKHVMCDLETMGTAPDSAIVSIGLVQFDEISMNGTLEVNIDLEDCRRWDLAVDQSTVDWWAAQSPEAIAAWQRNPSPLVDALRVVQNWLWDHAPLGDILLWGNGAAFDNVILCNAYRAVGADAPWKYYNDRCFRTMKGVFPLTEPPERTGTHHTALDDAITQVKHLQAICARYGITLS